MDTKQELMILLRTAEEAGRAEEAAAIERVIAFHDETREWVACLKCGAAFPTNEAHGRHWWRNH